LNQPIQQLEQDYVVEIDRLNKGQWADILLGFEDASLYQTWDYGAVHWREDQLSHLVLKHGNVVVAATQSRIVTLPVLGPCLAYITHGPLWRPRRRQQDPQQFRQIIRALCSEYVQRRGLFLRLIPNEFDHDDESLLKIARQEGFRQSRPTTPYRTFVIDLNASVQELRKGLHKRWREKLNRAQRNGLQITDGTDDHLYDIFTQLYRQMHARKKFVKLVDIDQFRLMQRSLPESLKMNISVCFANNEPIAALVWSAIGTTGFPVFSATGDKGMKLYGSYLLRWHLLEQLKQRGCRFFDQGGVDPQKNPGSYQFKASMGGRELSHLGQFDACRSVSSTLLVRAADLLRQKYRNAMYSLNKMRHAWIA